MKKLVKIASWFLGSILAILIIVLLSAYWWLSTEWKDFYSESEMQEIAKEIESTKSLPANFYLAYDKVYPNQRNRSLMKMTIDGLRQIINRNHISYRRCNSTWAANFFENKIPISYHSWSSFIIAHGITKYTTEIKCLDYCYYTIGIESMAYKNFSKPINELTVNENLELIIRFKSPTFYKQNPENLESELIKYK